MNKVSVLIRTKNEEQWIGHCIQSILDNIDNPEIIILDNNSSDRSLQIARSFLQDKTLKNTRSKSYTNIKFLNIQDYTPGKSLNKGVKNSKNDYVMIISAHCVISKIDMKKTILDLKKNVCVFGNQIPIFFGKKLLKRYIWTHFREKEVKNMFSELENRHFLHNAIAIYKKSFLAKNKFDENLSGKEDRYMAQEIINQKKSYLYDPNLEVMHHYTPGGKTWIGVA
jgi:rhamnosyltransferase